MDLGSLPETESRFSTYLFEVRDKLGVDHVAYAGMNPVNGAIYGHVTYDDAWKEHYVGHGFHRIDPTLHEARRSIAPVDWRRLEHSRHFKTVFNAARDFGISDRGLTVPVRGPFGDVGGLSVTADCADREWKDLKRHIMTDIQSVAVHVHDMVISSDSLCRVLNAPTLSAREKEVLQWIAAGKSQQDIGDILSISHRTVEVHLRSAREKLYALTTSQAVGRAISIGLIYAE